LAKFSVFEILPFSLLLVLWYLIGGINLPDYSFHAYINKYYLSAKKSTLFVAFGGFSCAGLASGLDKISHGGTGHTEGTKGRRKNFILSFPVIFLNQMIHQIIAVQGLQNMPDLVYLRYEQDK